MENSQERTVQFSGEEFVQIGQIAKAFWEKGVSENPPKFVILMGGIGSGKTTMRRQQYAEGYVNFDYGEIYITLKKVFGEDHPRIGDYLALASDLILRETINPRKNVVIEVTGNNEAMLAPVLEKIKESGYEVSIEGLIADVGESYKRHLKAVEEDEDYMSAYHTQEATLSSLLRYFG